MTNKFDLMKKALEMIVQPCDSITFFDCAYGIAVITDECFHGVYVYCFESGLWCFVSEYVYSEWKEVHRFIHTLHEHRSPFDCSGNLKDDNDLPF